MLVLCIRLRMFRCWLSSGMVYIQFCGLIGIIISVMLGRIGSIISSDMQVCVLWQFLVNVVIIDCSVLSRMIIGNCSSSMCSVNDGFRCSFMFSFFVGMKCLMMLKLIRQIIRLVVENVQIVVSLLRKIFYCGIGLVKSGFSDCCLCLLVVRLIVRYMLLMNSVSMNRYGRMLNSSIVCDCVVVWLCLVIIIGLVVVGDSLCVISCIVFCMCVQFLMSLVMCFIGVLVLCWEELQIIFICIGLFLCQVFG